jgi:hypothetical protein
MATSQVWNTPSKRMFDAITFENGLADRENCSPNMAMSTNMNWSQPAKRFRNPAMGFASCAQPGQASEKSLFLSIPAAPTFVADKVKGFLREQKRARIGAAPLAVASSANADMMQSGSESPLRGCTSPLRDCCTSPARSDALADETDDAAAGGCSGRKSSQKFYTVPEVQKIVQSAVTEREGQLRQEYDALLACHLREQFSQFTRFNQDHISRRLQQSTHDYYE